MSTIRLIEASLRTDQGRVREHNEDFVTCWEPSNANEEKQHGWLYILADGVGGAEAGEVASQYASERTVKHYLATSDEPDWSRRLARAIQSANRDLRQLVAHGEGSRMATTMVAAVITDQRAILANVGDSRGYLWRKGRLRQITKDQSLVAKLVEEGAITESEARNHPRKNVILYSLGSDKKPKIDVYTVKLEPDDVLLLCSDGLTRHISDDEIELAVTRQEPSEATQTLISLANSRGGEDNISVAIIRQDGRQAAAQKKIITGRYNEPVRGQTVLWIYTFLLALVQTILIITVWLLLRV
ncbi:MAG: Stp1/IreP family PP2C-type Ser/Thr phosphatase [Anaerolineae bacterium]